MKELEIVNLKLIMKILKELFEKSDFENIDRNETYNYKAIFKNDIET